MIQLGLKQDVLCGTTRVLGYHIAMIARRSF